MGLGWFDVCVGVALCFVSKLCYNWKFLVKKLGSILLQITYVFLIFCLHMNQHVQCHNPNIGFATKCGV